MSRLYINSKPAHCVSPRPVSDPGMRRHHYGAVQPMETPSLWARLFKESKR